MLLIYLILLFFMMTIYYTSIAVIAVYNKIKINTLLEKINSTEDLEYLRFTDLKKLTAEVFRRKGNRVRITDKCGEDENGMLLNDIQFVEIWKHSRHHEVDCEAAMKLAKCMRSNSIYRGMLITLGDFKSNTRLFCHKNVIECINGEQLLAMFKDVQKKRAIGTEAAT